jgi:hypothetical protein
VIGTHAWGGQQPLKNMHKEQEKEKEKEKEGKGSGTTKQLGNNDTTKQPLMTKQPL